ncbi:MAG: ECF transporter S component [Bacillota bacterium]|nr:ECF transporter S component [Bacillota bacterium]
MDNKGVQNLVRSGLLLAIAVVIIFAGKNVPTINQFLAGPGVNAVLLLTAYICGTYYGIGVGLLTPLVALLVGQLPSALGPFVPFIMIGNAIYVLLFGLLKDKVKFGKYVGMLSGSVLKFLFLFLSAKKLVTLFSLNIPKKALSKLAVMMGVPQLITALIGGIIAIAIIEILKARKVIE